MNTGTPYVKTATGNVRTGQGTLIGYYVNSTTNGTIVFHDSTAGDNAVSGTQTPAIGWHSFPIELMTGLYIVITNTLNVTLIYRPRN